jgi:hypothetical protein
MLRCLKFAAVSALFLLPCTHSAFAWAPLNYQEAVWMCSEGNLQACDAVYAYEQAPPGAKGKPLSTQDFFR